MIVRVLDATGQGALLSVDNIDYVTVISGPGADGLATLHVWSAGRKHRVKAHLEKAMAWIAQYNDPDDPHIPDMTTEE